MSLLDNIVGLYNFNGNANDGSGNHNHGTVTGATLTTDRFGNTNSAYNFDGTTAYIRLTDTPYDITTDITYSFGFYCTILTVGMILSKYAGGGIGHMEINTASSSGRMILQAIFRGAVNSPLYFGYAGEYNFQINTWYDITITYNNSTGKVRAYVDGVFIKENTQNVGMGNNSALLTMGARANDTTQYKYIGKIEYFYPYTRILSDAEIANISKLKKGNHSILSTGEYLTHSVSNLGVDSTGLALLLSMNGNARDGSGNHYHGTVTGATLTNDEFGNTNSAYEFDGVSKRIQITGFSLDNRVVQTQVFRVYANSISTNPVIFSYGNQGSISLLSTGQVRIELGGTGSIRISSPVGSILINTWYTIAVRYNNAFPSGTPRVIGDADIFINGVLQTKASTGTGTSLTTSNTINLACYSGTILFFNGKISFAKIYSRAMSNEEIQGVHNILLGKLSRIKGKTLSKFIDTNTALDPTIQLSQKKSILQSNSLITL